MICKMAGSPQFNLSPRLGVPRLDFQAWDDSESGVYEIKNRWSRFIVSPISKSRCGPHAAREQGLAFRRLLCR
jgi:hypothetical protein